jgi:CAI-1 autoinducer synthase
MSHARSERPALPDVLKRRIHAGLERRQAEEWRERRFFAERQPPAGAVWLHTNDYLNLARHPGILGARLLALRECGDPTLMSAAYLDRRSPQHEFETALAEHVSSDDAILCQSGWSANVGLLQTIADAESVIYIDQFAHMSLWDGAKRSGARIFGFRHNDPGQLAGRIARHGPGIVLVDSVYSTDGSVCPLREIALVAHNGGCSLVVDESHSLGTHGPRGEGLVAELGLTGSVLFRTASLSKAFSARGGVIACPGGGFSDYFRIESHEAIFSSAVHSHEARAFLATLRVVQSEGWRRERLFRNAARLRAGLLALGYDVSDSASQILALHSGSEYATLTLRDQLARRGVIGAPFMAPATPRKHALVRLTVHAGLTDHEISRVLAACSELQPTTRARRHAPTRDQAAA